MVPAAESSTSGIGFRLKPEPELATLSPLSLALLSLTRLDRLSRLLTPRSESIDRFGECELFTAFFRCRCVFTCASAGFPLWLLLLLLECLPFFEGESVKRPSHPCACDSATEPSVDVDQRERSVRSSSPPVTDTIERVDDVRRGAGACTRSGLSGVAGRSEGARTCETSMSTSKSNDERGDVGAESVWEYTLMLAELRGVVGH